MGRLSILIAFYWILLFENGPGINVMIFDLGNGLEIRLSLLIKVVFLLINLLTLLHFQKNHKIPKYLLWTGAFLLLSSSSVLFISPGAFPAALSVNLHILLMFNIILYIRYNAFGRKEIKAFVKALRLFALVNAILVIISYFYPDLLSVFESGTSKTGVDRAFGIMGDEVSVFLTFFLYNSIVFKRPLEGSIYFLAIFFTAGLGASLTAILLLIYHLVFVMRKTRFNLYLTGAMILPLGLLVISLLVVKPEIGVFKRIENTFQNDQNESAGLRLLSLSVAAEMIKEKPFFGQGFGNYRNEVIKKYEPKFIDAGQVKFFKGSASVILTSAFNPFVQMTAEAGIIGLMVFLFFLVSLFRSTHIKDLDSEDWDYKMNKSSRVWILIFLISTLSANWFLPSSFLLLLLVSLVGVNYKLKELSLVESV